MLVAGDDMVGLEQLEEDTDGMALLKARRSMGSMRAMSGANGMIYMEYKYVCSVNCKVQTNMPTHLSYFMLSLV